MGQVTNLYGVIDNGPGVVVLVGVLTKPLSVDEGHSNIRWRSGHCMICIPVLAAQGIMICNGRWCCIMKKVISEWYMNIKEDREGK
jgi:hypothetical protein